MMFEIFSLGISRALVGFHLFSHDIKANDVSYLIVLINQSFVFA